MTSYLKTYLHDIADMIEPKEICCFGQVFYHSKEAGNTVCIHNRKDGYMVVFTRGYSSERALTGLGRRELGASGLKPNCPPGLQQDT